MGSTQNIIFFMFKTNREILLSTLNWTLEDYLLSYPLKSLGAQKQAKLITYRTATILNDKKNNDNHCRYQSIKNFLELILFNSSNILIKQTIPELSCRIGKNH